MQSVTSTFETYVFVMKQRTVCGEGLTQIRYHKLAPTLGPCSDPKKLKMSKLWTQLCNCNAAGLRGRGMQSVTPTFETYVFVMKQRTMHGEVLAGIRYRKLIPTQ